MDLYHDDFAALALDVQDYVRKMKAEYAQYVGGATYVLRCGVSSRQTVGAPSADRHPDVLELARFLHRAVSGGRLAETGPPGHQSKNAALSGDAEPLGLPRALSEDGQAHGQLSHGAKRTAHLQHPCHGQVLRDQQSHPEPSPQPGGGGFGRSGRVQWRCDKEPFCLWEIQSVQCQAVGERRRVPLRDAGTEPRQCPQRPPRVSPLPGSHGLPEKEQGEHCAQRRLGPSTNCTLFVFENAANGHLHSAVLNPKLSGELRITLNFGADPGQNLTAIVYAEFENILEIDRNKAVLYDVYDGVGRRAG